MSETANGQPGSPKPQNLKQLAVTKPPPAAIEPTRPGSLNGSKHKWCSMFYSVRISLSQIVMFIVFLWFDLPVLSLGCPAAATFTFPIVCDHSRRDPEKLLDVIRDPGSQKDIPNPKSRIPDPTLESALETPIHLDKGSSKVQLKQGGTKCLRVQPTNKPTNQPTNQPASQPTSRPPSRG